MDPTTPPPVFDTEKCDVAYVPPVPDIALDPTINDPPGPINDCQEFVPPPLPAPPPCPAITIGGGDDGGSVVMNCDVTEPSVSFTITRSSCCSFDFALAIEIPCPDLYVGDAAIEAFKTDDFDAVPTISFDIVACPAPYDGCAFEFQIDISVPIFCPTLTVVSAEISTTDAASPPVLNFVVTKNAEDCSFDFEIEIVVPVGCPTFEVASAVIDTTDALSPPTISFTIVKPDPDACAFEFEIEIFVPVGCPTLEVASATIDTTDALSPPTISFTIVKPDPDVCAFDFEIEIFVPVGCPTLDVGTTSIETTDALSPPTISFTIVKPDPDVCAFEFNLEIVVPVGCPTLEVGTTSIETTDALSPPTILFTIVKPDPDVCAFEFNLEIVVPVGCPTLEVGTTSIETTDALSPPTLVFTIVKPDPEVCAFEFNLEIVIPTCVDLEITTTEIETTDEDSPPTLLFTVTKPVPEDCAFEFVLEIVIPVCVPFFTIDYTVATTSLYAAPTLTFTITKTPGCVYEVVFDLVVPAGCPNLGVGSAEIGTTDPDSPPTVDFSVEQPDPAVCTFLFYLDIVVPFCVPEFEIEYTVATTGHYYPPTLTFTIERRPDTCIYDVVFDLVTPAGCPTLGVGAAEIGTTDADSLPTIDFSVEQPDPLVCAFLFYLDIVVPFCVPDFDVTYTVATTSLYAMPALEFSVTRTPGTCNYAIEFALTVPAGCPELTVNTSPVATTDPDSPASLTFTVTQPNPAVCAWEFAFALTIPVCVPTFDIDATVATSYGLFEPTLEFTIERVPGGSVYDVVFDLVIPVVCTALAVGTSEILTTGPDSPPALVFTVTPGDGCSWTLDLSIVVPICVPEFEYDVWVSTTDTLTPSLTFTIERQDGTCVYDVLFHLYVPVVCTTLTVGTSSISTTDPDSGPTLDFDVTAGEGCSWTLDLAVVIPVCVPTFNYDIWVSTTDTAVPDLTFTITRDPGTCDYDVLFHLYVPYTPPCVPEFTVRTATVVTDIGSYDGSFTFDIVPHPTVPCRYYIDYEIHFPMPTTAAPGYVGTFLTAVGCNSYTHADIYAVGYATNAGSTAYDGCGCCSSTPPPTSPGALRALAEDEVNAILDFDALPEPELTNSRTLGGPLLVRLANHTPFPLRLTAVNSEGKETVPETAQPFMPAAVTVQYGQVVRVRLADGRLLREVRPTRTTNIKMTF